jgi:hypothetical protein
MSFGLPRTPRQREAHELQNRERGKQHETTKRRSDEAMIGALRLDCAKEASSQISQPHPSQPRLTGSRSVKPISAMFYSEGAEGPTISKPFASAGEYRGITSKPAKALF